MWSCLAGLSDLIALSALAHARTIHSRLPKASTGPPCVAMEPHLLMQRYQVLFCAEFPPNMHVRAYWSGPISQVLPGLEGSPTPSLGLALSRGGFWLGRLTGSCWMT